MRHRARPAALLAAVLLVAAAGFARGLALPADARAAITEYEIEPGAAPGTHVPLYLAAGTDGNLIYADAGTAPALGRMSTTGERITAIPLPSEPWAVLPAPGGGAYVSLATGVVTTRADGTLYPPGYARPVWGLAISSSEFLFEGTNSASGYQVCVASQCTPMQTKQARPLGLTRGPDGAVWATVYEADLVERVGPAGPNVGPTVALPVGSGPDQIVSGADGALWATMFDADAVDRITTAGQRTRFALPAGTEPDGIAAGPDGSLWIAGSGNGTILRMSTAGAVTGTWSIPTPASVPVGITTGPDGAIWFTESETGKLGRLVPDPALAPGARPGGGGGSSTGSVGDAATPRFLRTPAVDPRRVRAGRTVHRRFALSQKADVRIAVTHTVRGRRAGTRCVGPTRANRSARPCRRDVVVRSLRRHGHKGANAVSLSTRGLIAGRYRATLTATDAGGATSRAARVSFTVLTARKRVR
jgi:virginiamycin B lyase